MAFAYRTLTVYGTVSQQLRLTTNNTPPRVSAATQTPHNPGHATPDKYPHATGLGILRFRSPLLTESHLFSSPTGTKMFHFPAYPPDAYEFNAG